MTKMVQLFGLSESGGEFEHKCGGQKLFSFQILILRRSKVLSKSPEFSFYDSTLKCFTSVPENGALKNLCLAVSLATWIFARANSSSS